ncbi:uncharacterized protein METZ01_LOCUS501364 [marine metagenome]|uniref:Uncharacterized protein n=1 Tax=marine metagenome TaxID=408172 RepID=A0A383DWE5_9ZZZZ
MIKYLIDIVILLIWKVYNSANHLESVVHDNN